MTFAGLTFDGLAEAERGFRAGFLGDFSGPFVALGLDFLGLDTAIFICLAVTYDMWPRMFVRKCNIIALGPPKERRKMSANLRRSLEDCLEVGICCSAKRKRGFT